MTTKTGMGKKFLTLLLCAGLMLILLPVTALADATYDYIDENGILQTTCNDRHP